MDDLEVSASDLVRDALQVHVNESFDEDWLVTHFVAVAGLYRVREDGSTDTGVIVLAPEPQADYITDALLRNGVKMVNSGECSCEVEYDEADDEDEDCEDTND